MPRSSDDELTTAETPGETIGYDTPEDALDALRLASMTNWECLNCGVIWLVGWGLPCGPARCYGHCEGKKFRRVENRA